MSKTAYFNRFELTLPDECVAECYHQGACDDDVEKWACELAIDIDPELIRAELKECGAWSEEELQDNNQNVRRILWIAAGNIQEELSENER